MTTARSTRTARTILFLMVFCFACLPAYAQYSGGSGTVDDPYQIATAADLIALGETPDDLKGVRDDQPLFGLARLEAASRPHDNREPQN